MTSAASYTAVTWVSGPRGGGERKGGSECGRARRGRKLFSLPLRQAFLSFLWGNLIFRLIQQQLDKFLWNRDRPSPRGGGIRLNAVELSCCWWQLKYAYDFLSHKHYMEYNTLIEATIYLPTIYFSLNHTERSASPQGAAFTALSVHTLHGSVWWLLVAQPQRNYAIWRNVMKDHDEPLKSVRDLKRHSSCTNTQLLLAFAFCAPAVVVT